VVLLHGLKIHPFNPLGSTRAELSAWQKPGGYLVEALAANADVYSFAYAQHVPLDEVAEYGLPPSIKQLRAAGYREIILIGHSAGGLIARQLVEDQPDAGITKVIQVCAPNGGTSWARLNLAVRQRQEQFLAGLTREARLNASQDRADKQIPPTIEFVCVVGLLGRIRSVGMIAGTSQWTEDLQKQGVPVVAMPATHLTVMLQPSVADELARLAREPQPRWTPKDVDSARRRLGRLFPSVKVTAEP
jgi:pimeloyl-ACP methyl ester carboxylesterase